MKSKKLKKALFATAIAIPLVLGSPDMDKKEAEAQCRTATVIGINQPFAYPGPGFSFSYCRGSYCGWGPQLAVPVPIFPMAPPVVVRQEPTKEIHYYYNQPVQTQRSEQRNEKRYYEFGYSESICRDQIVPEALALLNTIFEEVKKYEGINFRAYAVDKYNVDIRDARNRTISRFNLSDVRSGQQEVGKIRYLVENRLGIVTNKYVSIGFRNYSCSD
jgi:hypothetical protein